MKRISGLLVIVMLLSVFAFGCGGGDDENTPVASGIAVEGDVINIGVFEPTTGENGRGGMQEVLTLLRLKKLITSRIRLLR